MVAERVRGLHHYFPAFENTPASLEKGREVTLRWNGALTTVIDELATEGAIHPSLAAAYQKSRENSSTNPDHGDWHAYFVYEGMRYLDPKGLVSDSLKQAAAFLHDKGQDFPFKHPQTGIALIGNQKRLHPDLAAKAIVRFGRQLGLRRDEIRQLARAVLRHDDVYAGVVHDDMSPLEGLLSDADKLFGAGLETDPYEITKGALKRNISITHKRTGFYMFRELDTQKRLNWRYGYRWLTDSFCAVLHEVYLMHFYTPEAMRLAQEKRNIFWDVAQEVYGDLFTQQQEYLSRWLAAQNPDVRLVGFKKEDISVKSDSIRDTIDDAYHRPFTLPEEHMVGGFTPAGWMIEVSLPDEMLLIDPSIARFAFVPDGRNEYMKLIKHAITQVKDATMQGEL